MVEIKVKPLEWSELRTVPDGPWSETLLRQRIGHHNLGPFAGSYSVQEMEAGGAWGWWNTWTSDRYPDGVEPTEDAAKAAAQSDFDKRIRSTLSLPEPVAQEAVAWQWRKVDRVMKHEEVWSFVDYHTGLKIKEFPEKYETRALGVIAEIGASREGGALVASDQHVDANEAPPAHPSPSPEQGEDDLVQRLRKEASFWSGQPSGSDIEALCREAATSLSTIRSSRDGYVKQATAREAEYDRLLSALRARVAELEARATPQAGASEAESVMPSMAKHRDGCEYSRSPIWLCDCPRPYLATPQDSDAVRALRNIAEGNLGDYPWQANYEKIREVARAALSGKGGSNG